MNPESVKTAAVWTETFEIPRFPTLTEDKTFDVCVVGVGNRNCFGRGETLKIFASTHIFGIDDGASVVVKKQLKRM